MAQMTQGKEPQISQISQIEGPEIWGICGMGILAHVFRVTGLWPVFIGKDAYATNPAQRDATNYRFPNLRFPHLCHLRGSFVFLFFFGLISVQGAPPDRYALDAAQDRLLERLRTTPFMLEVVPSRVARAMGGATRFLPGHSYGPWKENIVCTVFWVGESPSRNNPVPNYASAWDQNWQTSFGGLDDPRKRRLFFPVTFMPRSNPFYFALPFNDLVSDSTRPPLKQLIPWAHQGPPRPGGRSLCHGAWIAIRNAAGKVCYAQWQDVGPFEVDHWEYVFGPERPRPNRNGGAGLDISPAVRDYLGLRGLDVVDWCFVAKEEVPPGPWLYYGREGKTLDTPLLVRELRAVRGLR